MQELAITKRRTFSNADRRSGQISCFASQIPPARCQKGNGWPKGRLQAICQPQAASHPLPSERPSTPCQVPQPECFTFLDLLQLSPTMPPRSHPVNRTELQTKGTRPHVRIVEPLERRKILSLRLYHKVERSFGHHTGFCKFKDS
jgi:hypothetical protein